MRLVEIDAKAKSTVNTEDDVMSLVKLKKILNMIKSNQSGGETNASSVKKKILSRWKSGEKSISNYKQDLSTLDINLHDIIKK